MAKKNDSRSWAIIGAIASSTLLAYTIGINSYFNQGRVKRIISSVFALAAGVVSVYAYFKAIPLKEQAQFQDHSGNNYDCSPDLCTDRTAAVTDKSWVEKVSQQSTSCQIGK